VVAVAVVACGDDDSGSTDDALANQGWVGHVDDSDAFVAAVVGDGQVVAYVCDGDADIVEWFAGDVESDQLFSLVASSGAVITAEVDGGRWVGSVTLSGGTTHSFTAEIATGDAGLYRVRSDEAESDGIEAGWVVDNAGDVRGSLRVRGAARSVQPLSGPSLSVDGTAYPVVVYRTTPPDPRPATPPGVPVPYPNTVSLG
jgi:hypothetical protein